MASVDVKTTGVILEGPAGGHVQVMVDKAETAVAEETLQRIQARLRNVLQNPTGRYQSTLAVRREMNPVVDGNGTVYGAWIEGVSSRNARTRFKGYSTFRLIAQEMNARGAATIAERVIEQEIGRLG